MSNMYKVLCFSILILASAAGYAQSIPWNKSSCLSIDTEGRTSVAAFLVNHCGEDLKVTYCFGISHCMNPNGTGSTSIRAYGKRTIAYDREQYRSLIAYAVPEETPHSDYMRGVNEYFEGKNPDGPRSLY